MEETGGPGENHLSQVTDNFIMLYTSPWSRFELTISVVIGTDCLGSCEPHMKYQLKWDIQHILYFLHWQEYRIYLYDILYFLHWQSTEFFFTTFFIFYIDRVQNLSLRHCGITNKGAELIGQTIGSIKKSNTKLISLNLSGNKISDAGAEHIAMVSYYIYQYSHVWQNLCYSKDNVKLLYLQIYLFFCCIFQHLYLKNIKQM